jgi:outer membrane protein
MTAKLLLFLFVIIALGSCSVDGDKSHNIKIGYVNTQVLWEKIPEKKKADSLLKVYTKELNMDFNTRLNDFRTLSRIAGADDNSAIADSLKLVLDLKQNEIVAFKNEIPKKLLKRKNELNEPIREKMQKAVDKVAKNKKLAYVLDASYGVIIYRSSENLNIIDDVLKELGLD